MYGTKVGSTELKVNVVVRFDILRLSMRLRGETAEPSHFTCAYYCQWMALRRCASQRCGCQLPVTRIGEDKGIGRRGGKRCSYGTATGRP